MAGKEYKARDKVVNKMTKEGLTEVNLRDGSVREIDGRSRDRPLEKDGIEEKESHGLENDAESVNATANKRMRIRRYSSLRQKSLGQKENEEIRILFQSKNLGMRIQFIRNAQYQQRLSLEDIRIGCGTMK